MYYCGRYGDKFHGWRRRTCVCVVESPTRAHAAHTESTKMPTRDAFNERGILNTRHRAPRCSLCVFLLYSFWPRRLHQLASLFASLTDRWSLDLLGHLRSPPFFFFFFFSLPFNRSSRTQKTEISQEPHEDGELMKEEKVRLLKRPSTREKGEKEEEKRRSFLFRSDLVAATSFTPDTYWRLIAVFRAPSVRYSIVVPARA